MRVLALDLRGRGESDKPSAGYELSDHAADVIGVLDALGIYRAFIGGHSYGGMLTFWTAVNYSERVIGCVALDPPAQVDDTVREQIKPSLDRLDRVVSSFGEYLEAVKKQPYYEGWWDPLIENHIRADVEEVDGGVRARSKAENIAAVVEGTLHVDWDQIYTSVAQPSLVIRATQPFGPPGSTAILTPDLAQRIMSRLQVGEMVEIDANHMTMLFGDSADRTVAAILDFVGRV